LLLPVCVALAQPAFDVASVKPSPPATGDSININLGTSSHGVVTLTNTTLSECLRYAYDLVGEDQISGPEWMRDRSLRVDIVAQAPPDTANDQLLLMLQRLLAERFRLTLHREPRPVAHLELSIAKNGPKLAEAKEGAPPFAQSYGRGLLARRHLTTHTLAVLLSRQLRQIVIDKTGLTGFYDIQIEWTPDGAPPDTVADHPDIFAALQQQLGLKLEAKKTPIDIVVVDHAEKAPVGN
jgi:uncharacterized protein (TIGR03435 family)